MTPVKMKPACATDEYASMRLTLLWDTAVTVPIAMVRIAMAHISGRQSCSSPGSAT
jgi:hypothetical protein